MLTPWQTFRVRQANISFIYLWACLSSCQMSYFNFKAQGRVFALFWFFDSSPLESVSVRSHQRGLVYWKSVQCSVTCHYWLHRIWCSRLHKHRMLTMGQLHIAPNPGNIYLVCIHFNIKHSDITVNHGHVGHNWGGAPRQGLHIDQLYKLI